MQNFTRTYDDCIKKLMVASCVIEAEFYVYVQSRHSNEHPSSARPVKLKKFLVATSRYANCESRGSQSRLRRLRGACRWLPLFLELPGGGGASRPRKVVHYLQPCADAITGLFARRPFGFIIFFFLFS